MRFTESQAKRANELISIVNDRLAEMVVLLQAVDFDSQGYLVANAEWHAAEEELSHLLPSHTETP